MRPRGQAAPPAALILAGLAVACGGADPEAGLRSSDVVTADTIDPGLVAPGTVFRSGPATREAIEGPVYPPVVVGDSGQVSIYEGYFVQGPCERPLQVEAARGDTITVRVYSAPDTSVAGPCQEAEKPLGYAVLVGRFDPGRYDVRLIHDGDRARDPALDTVYSDIVIK